MPLHHVPAKRLSLNEPFASLHPNQILTFLEFCELNRISPRTGRRILASGKGPVVTLLSRQRIGITVENNAKWQASRAWTGPSEAKTPAKPKLRKRRARADEIETQVG